MVLEEKKNTETREQAESTVNKWIGLKLQEE
jgi:hypothetical protein